MGLDLKDSDTLGVARIARGFSARALARLTADMDPAMLKIAARRDPSRHTDFWARPVGWAVRDLKRPPSLGFGTLIDDPARRVNALFPADPAPPRPAKPFVLTSRGAERERAELCLTQAVYHEAALEPDEGQAAVAQVVLNRVRHPAFPKTICGVVYQGALRFTGCQFSFTCDGSVLRTPEPAYWQRARRAAQRALKGYVAAAVGTSTFYHADYVFPVWAPTFVKLRRIGTHIFYRFPGPAGAPRALAGRYPGGELQVSLEVHKPEGAEAAELALTQAAAERAEPPTPALAPTPPSRAGRRPPTAEEIARINAALAALPDPEPTPTP